MIAEAHGTSDALTASFSPELRELKNGTLVHVRARERNRTKTPVFKADETGAKGLVKGNNLSLEEGDIAGAGHWLELQYDEALDKWVLQNPAKGMTPASGVPVGTIEYFAMVMPPAGYLKADGAAVGRETYPDLFAAIGTTFGEGDGSSTFNLPDLIDRFAQGSATPGQRIEAGLPNIEGTIGGDVTGHQTGAFYQATAVGIDFSGSTAMAVTTGLKASLFNPIYGASDTVQPPALTLLPCIKAFDAAVNPGLIDITELANDVAGKAEKDLSNAQPAQSFKDACLQWTVPDYTAGISITSGYVAPKAGFIGLSQLLYNSRSSLSINNVAIYGASVSQVWTVLDITFPVAKGDVITFSNIGVTFYPCRGA